MHPIEFVQQRRSAKRGAHRPLIRSGQVSHAPLAEAPRASQETPKKESKVPWWFWGGVAAGVMWAIYDTQKKAAQVRSRVRAFRK